jgi:hypothetical protein
MNTTMPDASGPLSVENLNCRIARCTLPEASGISNRVFLNAERRTVDRFKRIPQLNALKE